MARGDHWFKNVTLVPGIVLAWIMFKPHDMLSTAGAVALAFLSTFLVASSNYTLNELVDAGQDKNHPAYAHRPVPSGKINAWIASAQWLLLAAAGLFIASLENKIFFQTELLFFVLGIIYNVKPLRTKDIAYGDILSESLNSPVRFVLGWLAIQSQFLPPISLIAAFWMLGAFFMSVKRLAELQYINNAQIAAAYRRSFAHYTRRRLLGCALVCAALFIGLLGTFIIHDQAALLLALPLIIGFLVAYLREGLKPNSMMRRPETLYKHAFLIGYLLLTTGVVMACLLIPCPWIKL